MSLRRDQRGRNGSDKRPVAPRAAKTGTSNPSDARYITPSRNRSRVRGAKTGKANTVTTSAKQQGNGKGKSKGKGKLEIDWNRVADRLESRLARKKAPAMLWDCLLRFARFVYQKELTQNSNELRTAKHWSDWVERNQHWCKGHGIFSNLPHHYRNEWKALHLSCRHRWTVFFRGNAPGTYLYRTPTQA